MNFTRYQLRSISTFGVAIALILTGLMPQFDRVAAAPKPNDRRLQILMPLYIYPTQPDKGKNAWQPLADAAKKVPTTAIINPGNGPNGEPPNADYRRGITLLKKAGVKVIGYVSTQYGKRPEQLVKADIDLYGSFQIDGIFLDETAGSTEQLAYYDRVQKYIKSRKNLGRRLLIVNPGWHIDEGYIKLPIDTALTFEADNGKNWREYKPRDYVKKYRPQRFALLLHDVKKDQLQLELNLARTRNYGYVYITDDSMVPDKNPWNSFPSYWQAEVDYIQRLNRSK
jgi:hypothetical protein